MSDEIDVLCDIDENRMEMRQSLWGLPNDNNVTIFMACLECERYYSPAHGYVGITEQGMMDSSNRRVKKCPTGLHGSMAIVGVKDGSFVWKCLHSKCRTTAK